MRASACLTGLLFLSATHLAGCGGTTTGDGTDPLMNAGAGGQASGGEGGSRTGAGGGAAGDASGGHAGSPPATGGIGHGGVASGGIGHGGFGMGGAGTGGRGTGGAGTGGVGMAGTAGSSAGADAGSDVCATAEVGASCAEEGAFCGGPCTDPCSFCNVIRCDLGTWQQMEVFPAPCFDCGQDRRCMAHSNYCDVSYSDVGGEPTIYECRELPAACANDATCDCVAAEKPADACTEGNSGEVTLEHFGG